MDRARFIKPAFLPLTDVLQTGISLPPAASVPRPDGHGTGGFSAPVRCRCDFTPYPRQFKGALQAAFAA
ncbi:TPA_asm: hypothetical protein G4P39_004943 [Salmonella enterica subsp. enterica serovar Muenchen]|nr:hypothetical protein [Salmonella enterica]EEI2878056.1 hypothetical protein [Salmonella enterica]EEJ2343494.1 hypothetical protein [Salmonella enterica subsp. enterica serovar Oslo]HAE7669244.1 hypothetical protein [Salmonella enterica subsp. enterica serovar Muenchen]